VGLGGYLTWTAVVREIKNRSPQGLRIVPVEVQGNTITKVVKSPIFENNPSITYDMEYQQRLFLQLNHPDTNYCKQDLPQRAVHRHDKHIIEQICEHYEIHNPQLKCELFFTEKEENKILDLTKGLNNDFLLIEPHSKTNYTKNRVYPFEKWQKIVDNISQDIQVVQIGVENARLLKDVTDLTGKTSFREAAALIGKSKMLVSTEGGLTHAATATETPAMVVITGYQSPRMVCYPQNINLNIANHGPCGVKSVCEECQKDAEIHDYSEIVNKIRGRLF
tara:strand:+ start:742 stop:1575 length:834 start_codon:yes stop_codon:yes gene_type:complete